MSVKFVHAWRTLVKVFTLGLEIYVCHNLYDQQQETKRESHLADFRRNHCITGDGRRSVNDRMRLSKRRNVRERINAT